jgi:hypothetical protein
LAGAAFLAAVPWLAPAAALVAFFAVRASALRAAVAVRPARERVLVRAIKRAFLVA